MSRPSIGSFLPQPKNNEKQQPRYVEEEENDDQIHKERGNRPSSSTSLSTFSPSQSSSSSLTIVNNNDPSLQGPSNKNVLALKRDNQGQIDYSGVIARQGHSSNRIIQTSYTDLIPLRQRARAGEISLARPTQEDVQSTTERTKAAIEKIISGKVESSKPQSVAKRPGEPTYVRYTPASVGGGNSGSGRQRIIKMVDVAQDPLAPPKFKHTKVPAGPPSPPPPVLRSPPRKLTAKDQEDWYIPPSISNWKNPKGFTIALDKRVAADGRGLQEVQVNDNMAKLSEALYAADRSAREEIRQRAAMQQKLAEKENAAKEERLRMLAQQAREERARAARETLSSERRRGQPQSRSPSPENRSRSRTQRSSYDDNDDEYSRSPSPPQNRRRAISRSRSPPPPRKRPLSRSPDNGERYHRSRSPYSEERERERIRAERKREAEKELRMSRMGAEKRVKMLARDSNRDISEKVALGIAKPTKPTGESQFDARLFSQVSNTGGLGGSGYSEDQVYDKSLFAAQEAVRSIYRPRGDTDAFGGGGEDDDGEGEMQRIQREKRFEGLGVKPGEEVSGPREGPVEFVKDTDDDPFGVNQMVDEVKKSTSISKKYGLNGTDS